jgi:HJR/Mrr/RecB family endonuclease
MEHYRYKGVTHCMVITTGEFTQDARDEAQNLGVALWDGKRLLEEIYKDQFFYVPENESDYDPNK